MQYIVEVCMSDGGLVDAMANMRTWLDRKRIEPLGFRHCRDTARMMFQVDFNNEPDAIEFSRAFGGRMVGGPATPVAAAVEVAEHLLATDPCTGCPGTGACAVGGHRDRTSRMLPLRARGVFGLADRAARIRRG